MSTLAFDLGTASLKCGYAGATNPQFIPSIAGTPKFAQDAVTAISLGTEAYKKRAVMTLTNICSRGIVLNWDYFEQIYAHAFKALDVPNTEASTIMLTCPIKQSYGDVEKSSQIMFETFSVQAVGFEHQPVLSALANGFTTCAVVESGEGLTQLAVVQDGVLSKRAQQRLLIGGSDVSAYFAHLVQLLGYNLTGTSSDMILARDMKEKLCYVASDLYDELALFVKDTTNSMEKTYELPDGTMLSIGREMVYAPDIMFDPMSYDFEIEGVHSILHTMVQKHSDLSQDLYKNIILSGGNTKFDGFANRLQKEVACLANVPVSIHASSNDSQTTVWRGASMAATLSSTKFCSKNDYDENGPNFVCAMAFK